MTTARLVMIDVDTIQLLNIITSKMMEKNPSEKKPSYKTVIKTIAEEYLYGKP